MSLAMIQFSYKSETVGKLIQNPEDRAAAVRSLVESFGGKMLSFYYSYGDYDGTIIVDMPDNVSTLATVMTAFSGGGTSKLKTTILISVEEAMAAMKKSKGMKLEQPKG